MEFYTEHELDLLRRYTDRPPKGSIHYKSKLNERLGMNEFSNDIVNTFLGTKGMEPSNIYSYMRTGEDLREFIGNIETLFGLMCKYGKNHVLPWALYREECQHKEINSR